LKKINRQTLAASELYGPKMTMMKVKMKNRLRKNEIIGNCMLFYQVTGQLKSCKLIIYHQHEISDRQNPPYALCLNFGTLVEGVS
jgi:hypothetical protein